MVLAGVAVLAWVLVVWRWQDPFTAVYTHWKQHQLAQSYKHRFADYHPTRLARAGVSVSTTRQTIAREARTGFVLTAVRRSAGSASPSSG